MTSEDNLSKMAEVDDDQLKYMEMDQLMRDRARKCPPTKHDGAYQEEFKQNSQDDTQNSHQTKSQLQSSKSSSQSSDFTIANIPECELKLISNKDWEENLIWSNNEVQSKQNNAKFSGMLVRYNHLTKKIYPFCSASLLDTAEGNTIMTAAHCLANTRIKDNFKKLHFSREKWDHLPAYWCPLYNLNLFRNKVKVKDIKKCGQIEQLYVIYPSLYRTISKLFSL